MEQRNEGKAIQIPDSVNDLENRVTAADLAEPEHKAGHMHSANGKSPKQGR